MFGIVNMRAWDLETAHNYYHKWSDRAQRVIAEVGKPTYENGRHEFYYSVTNPENTRRYRRSIVIDLTKDGTFEYVRGHSKTYPEWYVTEVSRLICELYAAFAKEGFLI